MSAAWKPCPLHGHIGRNRPQAVRICGISLINASSNPKPPWSRRPGEYATIRVARLESDVSHIRSDISLIHVDLRDLRKTMDTRFEKYDVKLDALDAKLDDKFSSLASKIGELKVWGLLVIGAGVLSIVGRALHWF